MINDQFNSNKAKINERQLKDKNIRFQKNLKLEEER